MPVGAGIKLSACLSVNGIGNQPRENTDAGSVRCSVALALATSQVASQRRLQASSASVVCYSPEPLLLPARCHRSWPAVTSMTIAPGPEGSGLNAEG